MICVYRPGDAAREGHGVGVLHPFSCTVTETAGGPYELVMELPAGRESMLIEQESVITVPGAPHRLSGQVQPFRVYAVSLAGDGSMVEVRAQHLFYDLTWAIVQQVDVQSDTACCDIAAAMMAGLMEPCGFTMDADCTGKAAGTWALCSVVNGLLDTDAGLLMQGRLEMERDGTAVRLRDDTGRDSGVTLRYGGSLRSLTATRDTQAVATRLYPVGEAEDGSDLLLPERYIDAPTAGQYAAPRPVAWKVSGAVVGQKVRREDGKTSPLTLEEVYDKLREAAADKLRKGCDQAQESMQAVSIPRPAALRGQAETLCLYDRVQVRHAQAGVEVETRIIGYTWDALRGCYEQLVVGDPWQDGTAGLLATAPQLRQVAGDSKRVLKRLGDMILIEADDIVLQGQRIALLASNTSDLEKRTSAAEITLDGVNARIDLMATRKELTEQGERISQAEIAIDGANAAIALRAKQTDLEAMGKRVSAAEIAIDGANATISLKASQETVDELGTRVSAAEIAIDGANSTIKLKADKVKVDALETEIAGLLKVDELAAEIADLSDVRVSSLSVEGTAHCTSLEAHGASSVDGNLSVSGELSVSSLVCGGEDIDFAAYAKTSDLSSYAKKSWVNEQNFAKESYVTALVSALNTKVSNLESRVSKLESK